MQNDSSGRNQMIPPRLQDYDITKEFPPHIRSILNTDKPISISEMLCRLLHVCIIETGFVPIIDEEPEFEAEIMGHMTISESVPKLVESLQRIVEKVGNLHNVTYSVILNDNGDAESEETSQFDEFNRSNESSQSLELLEDSESNEYTDVIPIESKESGDGSIVINSNALKEELTSGERSAEAQHTEVKKVYSEKMSVTIIHEGLTIYTIANSSSLHKNTQISIPHYIRPNNPENFPMSAKVEEYSKLMNFSVIRFVNDVKRGFCYPIMDEIGGLSFDTRSLSWFPAEIIVEIAKRCGSMGIFRLRGTCSAIRNALSDNNQQFWKGILKRDFPQCNTDHLKTDPSPDKYFRKYKEMWNYTYRRPLRRTVGRVFPYYLLNNFSF